MSSVHPGHMQASSFDQPPGLARGELAEPPEPSESEQMKGAHGSGHPDSALVTAAGLRAAPSCHMVCWVRSCAVAPSSGPQPLLAGEARLFRGG